MRSVLLLVVGLLPAHRFKNVLLGLLGGPDWSIDRAARIGPNVFWRVGRLTAAANTYIGPGNVFRELTHVDLQAEADIGQFNWFSAQARYVPQSDPELAGCLIMRRGSHVTSRHYVDCAGGVVLDELALVAGVRSTFLTHYADPHCWELRGKPIRLGASCLVFTNVVVTAGTSVAPRCVVAAGAVVSKDLDEPGKLYAGMPAKAVSDLSRAAFAERRGSVLLPREEARRLLREQAVLTEVAVAE